jgi:hypothetical protein
MTNYNLNVKPGKVVKETYTKTYTQVVARQPPVVEGSFEAPYVAKIDVTLGTEKMVVDTQNGEFNVQTVKYDNDSKSKRLMNLGKVVSKIVSSEFKSIFGKNNQVGLTYTGLPAEATDAVNNARERYNQALQGYQNSLGVPEQKTIVTNREVLTITPSAVNIDTQTIDNRL